MGQARASQSRACYRTDGGIHPLSTKQQPPYRASSQNATCGFPGKMHYSTKEISREPCTNIVLRIFSRTHVQIASMFKKNRHREKCAFTRGAHLDSERMHIQKGFLFGIGAYSDKKVFILDTDSIQLAVRRPLFSLQCSI